jgi:hypothetical protein
MFFILISIPKERKTFSFDDKNLQIISAGYSEGLNFDAVCPKCLNYGEWCVNTIWVDFILSYPQGYKEEALRERWTKGFECWVSLDNYAGVWSGRNYNDFYEGRHKEAIKYFSGIGDGGDVRKEHSLVICCRIDNPPQLKVEPNFVCKQFIIPKVC